MASFYACLLKIWCFAKNYSTGSYQIRIDFIIKRLSVYIKMPAALFTEKSYAIT